MAKSGIKRLSHRQDAKIAKSNRWKIAMEGNENGFHGHLFGASLAHLATWRFKFFPFVPAFSCNNPWCRDPAGGGGFSVSAMVKADTPNAESLFGHRE